MNGKLDTQEEDDDQEEEIEEEEILSLPLSEVGQVMELGSVYIVDPLFNSLILIVSIALIANVRTVLVVLIRFGVCHWGWRLRNRVTRKCAL